MRLGDEENNMITHLVSTSRKWALKTVSAYRASREGIAAIEFAFVAPIMIVMYLGLAELSLLISEDRRVSHAANVAGDLTTQESTITRASMAEIMNAVLLTLENEDRAKIEITSYNLDEDGNIDTIGQAKFGDDISTPYNENSIDTRLLNATSGVVVARIEYDYQFSLMTYKAESQATDPIERRSKTVTLSDTFLLKPRQSTQVNFEEDTGGNTTYSCSLSGGTVSC